MSAIDDIKQSFESYAAAAIDLWKNSSYMDGFLGLGHDPRRDPMHKAFYTEVQGLLERTAAEKPESAEAKEIILYIFCAEEHFKDAMLATWMMAAAQGHTSLLIPFLNSDDAYELRKWYDEHYPRRKRLPIQDQIYKQLKIQSK